MQNQSSRPARGEGGGIFGNEVKNTTVYDNLVFLRSGAPASHFLRILEQTKV